MESIWKRQVNGVQAQRLALFSRYGVDVEALFDDIGHIAATSQLSATPSAPSALLFFITPRRGSAYVTKVGGHACSDCFNS